MPEPFHSRHDGYIRHHLETGERKIIGIGRQVMGRRKSGAIFPMHLSVSAFTAEGRRYFTGIVHDLSEQRGTGALREQALFEAIFNHLPDAVLVTDAASRIVLCNPAVGARFRPRPRGDHRARNQCSLRHSRRARAHFERWRYALREQEPDRARRPYATAASRARASPPRRSPPRCATRTASSSASSSLSATSASRWCRTRPCANRSAWRRSASCREASRTISTTC